MAVRCSGCGREYDVTLFQFGRTIHCTCGARVGLAHRLSIPPRDEGLCFIADAMLGRLARWLRTLGFDTAFDDSISDSDLVRRAVEEGRQLLTRDRRLFDEWRIEGGLLIRSERPTAQLREVVSEFQLRMPTSLFTRCRLCNHVLGEASDAAVRRDVPERVRETAVDFRECPGCGRVYWEGTHTERMKSVLTRVFWDGDPP